MVEISLPRGLEREMERAAAAGVVALPKCVIWAARLKGRERRVLGGLSLA